jgi:phospholipid/cholesterol/gamma-HCH transport system permease protein
MRAGETLKPVHQKMPEPTESPSRFSRLGDRLKSPLFTLQDYVLLSTQAIASIFSPPLYWPDTLNQMDIIGVGSIPIIIMAFLSIGGVLVLNTAAQLTRFGMAALTGDGVSLALVRELGPTITALLVAGRNASGMASELGSMVVTEQVDAMRALGTDPIRKLMVPRIIATALTMPLLVATGDFFGLIGGFMMAHITLRLGAVQFWTRAVHALDFGDLVQGIVKPFIFALILSTVGCYQGLRVKGGTEGVGRATTTAFLWSALAVLISDAFLSRLLLSIFK